MEEKIREICRYIKGEENIDSKLKDNDSFPENFNIENLIGKKRKLSEEEKDERRKNYIKKYCKRNDEIKNLLEIINQGKTSYKNIKRILHLLNIDLADSKKIVNQNSFLSNKKKDLFERLKNLSYSNHQLFWYMLTNGKTKKGKAQLIKSSNISLAKKILKEIEKYNSDVNEENDKIKKDIKRNIKTMEIIKIVNMRESKSEQLDKIFLENNSDLSSDSSSSLDDSDEENEEGDFKYNNIKNINIHKEK